MVRISQNLLCRNIQLQVNMTTDGRRNGRATDLTANAAARSTATEYAKFLAKITCCLREIIRLVQKECERKDERYTQASEEISFCK